MNNTRILADGISIDNDTWKTGLNNNDLIIGPSGAGKTRSYVMPNIMQTCMQANESMIVTDTKGQLKHKLSGILKEAGYQVIDIDFTDMKNSPYGYNPFDYIRYDEETDTYDEQDIMKICRTIIPLGQTKEPFWEQSAQQYLSVCIGYMLQCLPRSEHRIDVMTSITSLIMDNTFDEMMGEMEEDHPQSASVKRYRMMKRSMETEKTVASVMATLSQALDSLMFNGAAHFYGNPRKLYFPDLGKERIAVFLTVSDTDRSMDKIVNLFYAQALQSLCWSADRNFADGRLAVPVRMYLDDFATNTYIEDFDKIISVIRSREIYVSVILQSISQLNSLYGEACAATIANNCDNWLYLGGQDYATAELIAKRAGRLPASILDMPLHQSWLITRGMHARSVQKYPLQSHPLYEEMKHSFEQKMKGKQYGRNYTR